MLTYSGDNKDERAEAGVGILIRNTKNLNQFRGLSLYTSQNEYYI